MSDRARLHDRTGGDNLTLYSRHQGREIELTVNPYPDGRPGAVFVHGMKSGSHTQASLLEFCTLLSIALQRGMPLQEIHGNLQRENNGLVCTTQGEIIEALMKREG